MKREPAMIRRPTPFAVDHIRASVGEDPFLLASLHNTGLDRRILRFRLGAGFADVPENTEVLLACDDGLLYGALLRPARVAGLQLLCRLACRLSLSSDTRGEGQSWRPLIWRLAAGLSVDVLDISDRQDARPVLGSPN